ncbi:MAG: FMN-binding negative transcriptional regulator [Planctomycetota bacterium]
MSYPPSWRQVTNPAAALELMRAHPLAHLFCLHGGHHVTRIPFLADTEDGQPTRLRAHLNAQNPQVEGLDGARVLVAFSGHSTYVSPHWRVEPTRAGTFDYEEVIVRGTARVVEGEEFFRTMIDDLSALLEPRYPEVGDYPEWRTAMAPPGYIERLLPLITLFVVEIEDVEVISKLHQQFPEDDRRSIADHLARCDRDGARAIADKIRRSL